MSDLSDTNMMPKADLLDKVSPTWRSIYSSALQHFSRLPSSVLVSHFSLDWHLGPICLAEKAGTRPLCSVSANGGSLARSKISFFKLGKAQVYRQTAELDSPYVVSNGPAIVP